MAGMWKERGQERLDLWVSGRPADRGRGSRKCTLGVGNGDCCNLYELELLWDIGFTNGKGPEIS